MSAPSRGTVLVVEDDVGTAQAIKAILEDEGYRVEVASDGREALACVAQGLPDVVLLDMMMPVMDGWETSRALAADEQARRVPVVLMTASQQLLPGVEVPYAAVLPKPFELDEMLGIVARAVGREAPGGA